MAICIVTEGQRLYAGTAHGGIFVSSDYGSSWHPANNGLTSTYTMNIIASEPGLFASTVEGGVFFSSNGGANWTTVNAGLPKAAVYSMCVDGAYLYAGTLTDGVWRRPLTEIVTSVGPATGEIPASFVLRQNYPNPFNPTTTIRYELPQAAKVTLKVYDVLGREIVTLVDQAKEAGVYEVKFDGSNLPSGIYLYRMEAGPTVSTKKLVLLK
jgi:hypothetical protein